jgi:fucose permease
MFVQAMVINLTPLFFIPLQREYGLSFEQLGRLVLLNFFTQMAVDLLCTAVVDRFGLLRPLTLAAQLLAVAGLWLFAAAGWIFPQDPYAGLLLGTIVFSMGCGLLEVLVSPIIQAVPTPHKENQMALLHAFYPIGKVVVVLVTALVLSLTGPGAWRWIALAWSLVPLLNTLAFWRVELSALVHEHQRQKTRAMARNPAFWFCLGGIFLAGAAEVTLAQWTSAYAQVALDLSPLVANMIGFGFFSAMMIFGRPWFGLRGQKLPLRPVLGWSALWATVCYLVVALAPGSWAPLGACILAGLFVSMLWPGFVSLAAGAFPRAGVSLFALLAAFGDAGAGAVPWLVGALADVVGSRPDTVAAWVPSWLAEDSPSALGLRLGLLGAALFPALLLLVVRFVPELRSGPTDQPQGP